jgi:hypothetical protein
MNKNTLSIQITEFYIGLKYKKANLSLTLQDRQKCISVVRMTLPLPRLCVRSTNTLSVQITEFFIELKHKKPNSALTLRDRQKCISVVRFCLPLPMLWVMTKNTLSIQIKKLRDLHDLHNLHDLHENGWSNGYHIYEKSTPSHRDLSNNTSNISLRRLVQKKKKMTAIGIEPTKNQDLSHCASWET